MEKFFELAENVVKGLRTLSDLKSFEEERRERKPLENPFKRSALIVSGDRIEHLRKVFTRNADVLIFNVEDGVSDERKDLARWILRKFLVNSSFDGSKEIVIRVNSIDSPFFWDDLTVLLPVVPHGIRLSKVKSPQEVYALDRLISSFERSEGVPEGFIKIQLSIETPQALLNLGDLIEASNRVNAVYLGILDMFSALSIPQRLSSGKLGEYVRERFVFEARSKGVYAIAPAFQDYENLKGFEAEALSERELGFSGKMCISVRQVEIANKVFSPSPEEIEEAKEIVEVYERALKEGKGGVAYKGRFLDQPVYKGALNILRFCS